MTDTSIPVALRQRDRAEEERDKALAEVAVLEANTKELVECLEYDDKRYKKLTASLTRLNEVYRATSAERDKLEQSAVRWKKRAEIAESGLRHMEKQLAGFKESIMDTCDD